MSLFNELQWEIIEKPRQTYNYLTILKEKKENEEDRKKREKQEWKQLCEEKKKEMSKEEFNKWRQREWYQRNKKKHIKKQLDVYYKNKAEEEVLIEEIYKDVYDVLPEPINYDKYYTAKFRNDDVNSENKYKFCWWSSKLMFENWKFMRKRKKPFRIYWRKWVKETMNNLATQEARAYQLLLPHLDELDNSVFYLKEKQTLTKYPLWYVTWKLAELIQSSDIAPSHVCNVLSAIQRWKYIASEVYLWRASFIIGDVLVTQTGSMFQISLENNLPWLTPDNIEEIHEIRMKRRKKKWKEKPPIYMVRDAYLVKIPINERENLFYIIPT